MEPSEDQELNQRDRVTLTRQEDFYMMTAHFVIFPSPAKCLQPLVHSYKLPRSSSMRAHPLHISFLFPVKVE